MAITVGGVSVQAFWIKSAKISKKMSFEVRLAKSEILHLKTLKIRDFCYTKNVHDK